MNLEELFHSVFLSNNEVDVLSKVAKDVESAEEAAIREASSLTSPGFDGLVCTLFDMESVNLINFFSLQFRNFQIKSTLTKR